MIEQRHAAILSEIDYFATAMASFFVCHHCSYEFSSKFFLARASRRAVLVLPVADPSMERVLYLILFVYLSVS